MPKISTPRFLKNVVERLKRNRKRRDKPPPPTQARKSDWLVFEKDGYALDRTNLLYVLSPIILNLGLVIFFAVFPKLAVASPVTTFSFALASAVATIVSFIPAFNEEISDGLAFTGLVLNGVLLIVVFALIHLAYGSSQIDMQSVTAPVGFWNCLYFSIVTFTTLGYGDFQPAPPIRLLAGLEALMGYVFLGFVVANANDWMSDTTKKAPKQWDFKDIVNGVFRRRSKRRTGSEDQSDDTDQDEK